MRLQTCGWREEGEGGGRNHDEEGSENAHAADGEFIVEEARVNYAIRKRAT